MTGETVKIGTGWRPDSNYPALVIPPLRQKLMPYVGIAMLGAALVLLVNPLGDFPISDDWAYAKAVRDFLSTGRLQFSDWGAMNLISHISWGTAFGAMFGPSYTILRLSTLVLALGGAWAVFYLCSRAGVSGGLSAIATVTSTLNPFYFFCSFTYMTDVSYAAMQMIAVALLAGTSSLARGGGWAAALWALLCRQTGLAIAAAWGVAQLRRRCSVKRVALAVAALAIFVVIQVTYQHWLSAAGIAPKNLGSTMREAAGNIVSHPIGTLVRAGQHGGAFLFYIGLFTLPITSVMALTWLGRTERRERLRAVAGWLLLTLATSFAMIETGSVFPMLDGTISRSDGFGTEFNGAVIPPIGMALLTIASTGGAVIFLLAAAYALMVTYRARQDQPTTMIAILAIATFAPIPFLSHPFDRYLIPVLPCVAIVLAVACCKMKPTRIATCAGLVVASFMAVTSVAATHDYLSWKRTQKTAYDYALTLAPADQVDGGWVLNAERFFPVFYGRPDIVETWHMDQEYRILPNPQSGYDIVRRYPVPRWLLEGDELLLLRRAMPNLEARSNMAAPLPYQTSSPKVSG